MSQFFRDANAFAKQSTAVLSVFTKTLAKLDKLNVKMLSTKDKINAEIQSRQDEIAIIDNTLALNKKVVNNISKIVS